MRFSRPLTYFVLTNAVISMAWSADASEKSLAQQKRCINQINQRTAALVAQDWSELERLSEHFIKTCENAFDAEVASSAYEQIALSNVTLRNPTKALEASNLCIRLSYSNSGCHLQKTEALIQLGRIADAKSSLDKTERLVQHQLEQSVRDLRDARTALDRELLEARLANLNAQQAHASALRDHLFSR
jgi:hypothetical protein